MVGLATIDEIHSRAIQMVAIHMMNLQPLRHITTDALLHSETLANLIITHTTGEGVSHDPNQGFLLILLVLLATLRARGLVLLLTLRGTEPSVARIGPELLAAAQAHFVKLEGLFLGH